MLSPSTLPHLCMSHRTPTLHSSNRLARFLLCRSGVIELYIHEKSFSRVLEAVAVGAGGEAKLVYQDKIGVSVDMQWLLFYCREYLAIDTMRVEQLSFASQPADRNYTYPSSSSRSASSTEFAISPASASLAAIRLLIAIPLIRLFVAFSLTICICIIFLNARNLISGPAALTPGNSSN